MAINKITISGKICTGKSTLLRSLQKELNWPVFMTGQLFREYVKKNKLNLEHVEEQNEALTKKIDFKVRNMLKLPGNLIVDGWMSGIMANNFPNILKVLLVCDDNIRYQRFADREKISSNEAKLRVDERQNNWLSKLKKIYKRDDFMDPKNYDLVIDTSDLSLQDILKKVLQKIQE
ncbi:MAG: cytidylate kinase family protein [Patescibacteria group bacterium]|jgi:predicted cytidylate kinase